jgi:predicted nucleic acid-binding protein
LRDTARLIVPALAVFEVFKCVLQQRDENAALQAAALMQQGRVVPLDTKLALAAAKLSVDLKLPLADSVMLACARAHNATFWTQDADFASIPGVKYRAKT